ncbi:hypothetical protein [Pedobacter sp. ASV28]|uniref:hypothetical protein n=1 Tax=Pedobacter sp. ASV28 TaxID=2795123 RepID=UPI0018EB8DEC|nr:hypothetical protein [Pedobacter sp. ASV28]
MKDLTEIKMGRMLTIGSFALGTILFLAYSLTQNGIFAILGLYYLMAVIPANLIIPLAVIVGAFINRDRFPEYVQTIILMLLNIPIALFYLRLI